jgi:hypothetical protein
MAGFELRVIPGTRVHSAGACTFLHNPRFCLSSRPGVVVPVVGMSGRPASPQVKPTTFSDDFAGGIDVTHWSQGGTGSQAPSVVAVNGAVEVRASSKPSVFGITRIPKASPPALAIQMDYTKYGSPIDPPITVRH